MSTLCSCFCAPPVYFLILSCLTHLELVRVARVCRHGLDAVNAYQRAAFNINHYLSPFFNPLAFRSLQARTGTLISGVAAYDFIARDPQPPVRIELVVYTHQAFEVVEWLLAAEYTFSPTHDTESDLHKVMEHLSAGDIESPAFDDVRQILSFKKLLPGSKSMEAMVMVAVRSPLEVVLRLGSTVQLTLISWDRAYCMFPRASLHNLEVLVLRGRDGRFVIGDVERDLFESKRFNVREDLSEDECAPSHPKFPLGCRWVNDASSLAISLDTNDIVHSPGYPTVDSGCPTFDSLETCGFTLRYDPVHLARVEFSPLLSLSRRYGQTVPGLELLYQLERELRAQQLDECDDRWVENWRTVSGTVVRELIDRDRMALDCLED